MQGSPLRAGAGVLAKGHFPGAGPLWFHLLQSFYGPPAGGTVRSTFGGSVCEKCQRSEPLSLLTYLGPDGDLSSINSKSDPLFYTRRELLELVVVIINAILSEKA
jgi:hypothetical protein